MGNTKKRAKQRQEERRRQRQRNIAIVVGVIAVVLVGVIVLATRPTTVDVPAETLTRYEGIPTTYDDRGFPVLGNPAAPARLVEYSSFDCPSCRNFHDNVTVNIIDRIRSGEASFTYVPVFGTGGIANGDRAAEAALCVGEQGKFWEYHDLLFDWQGRYVSLAFQTSRLEAGVTALGLDLDAFRSCMSSNRNLVVLDSARAALNQVAREYEGQSVGTPTLILNNERIVEVGSATVINNRIDAIMQTNEPVPLVAPTEEAPAEEVEATEEVPAEEVEATEEAPAEEAEATEEAPAEEAEATEEATEEAE